MKLRKITLKNIRSYKHQEVEFPEGSILLSGDIGSGKTSILLAIEFALFGLQPGQKGASLLRNGETSGGVVMELEIDGKNIIIERTIKKGKTVSQDYCSVVIDGIKKEISVMELKSLILELLNYPPEFSKKQNLLYKFTVYTPQEEMKEIILQDSETRINTLRHIFGIDKYKKILENASLLVLKVREEKKLKEGVISSLEADKINLLEKENDLEMKYHNLSSVEKEFFIKAEARKKVQEEKEKVQGKMDEKSKILGEIEKAEIKIMNKKENISYNDRLINQLKMQIEEMEDVKFDISALKSLENELNLGKKEKEELNNRDLEVSSQLSSLNLRNQENNSLKLKISHIDTCPTCLQKVDISYKNNVLRQVNSDIEENRKKMGFLEKEKKIIIEKKSEIDLKISNMERKIREQNLVKIKLQNLDDKQARMLEIQKTNGALDGEISILNKNIGIFQGSLADLNKFDGIFNEKIKEFELAVKQEKSAEIKVVELKKEIEVFSRQIEELRNRIKKTEEAKKQMDYLIGLENWISGKFVPLISFIEKNVMLKLKSEFSKLFREWFSILVPENFNVRLDDDFTPIIEQHDYELDYSYMSGGERTAIALAYRLSLNQVINSLLSKIKTRDLVILDEPTDGFSSQQLDKMRDVLQQLNVKQLIIVSHEPKIESFVENIIRFKKVNGVSVKE